MNKPETLVDVYRLLPEGTPIQVINNQFYMSPSPAFAHFSIAREIFRSIDAYVLHNNLGEAIYAPVDVYLGDKNAVQPDLFFIAMLTSILLKTMVFMGHQILLLKYFLHLIRIQIL